MTVDFISPCELAGLSSSSPVLLALSGGADSRALLDLLAADCKKRGAPLFAAHIDHNIRPDEHERDRRFCEELGRLYCIPVFVLCADIPTLAAEHGCSEELESRRVRYVFFEKVMRENGIPLLATAHNADDNLETIIFNLTRGTGLRGLCGIPRMRALDDGFVVRPILGMTKAETLEYCRENRLEFVTDCTNADDAYSRNRIRLNVIPELNRINPSAAKNALRLSASLADDRRFIEDSARDFLFRADRGDGLSAEALCSADPSIAAHALALAFSDISDESLQAVHIEALLSLCKIRREHSSVSLPGGLRGEISRGLITFTDDSPAPKCEAFRFGLKPGANTLPDGSTLFVSAVENKKTINTSNVYSTVTRTKIASDKIIGALYVRSRAPGDKILLNGMHKSVKKLMCDMKLPAECRGALPFVCDDDGIVWIPFVGTRDGAKYSENKNDNYINLDFCQQ